MKNKRIYLFIACSSVALLLIIGIQVKNIIDIAQMKEDLFNEKANMVLSKTTEALGSNKEACKEIATCFDQNDNSNETPQLGINETQTIDSLLKYYMHLYHFPIQYSFVVVKKNAISRFEKNSFSNAIYPTSINDTLQTTAVELKLILPNKQQFIRAEMGVLFISSIILVFIVLILFLQTVLSLLKEKRIAANTNEILNNMAHEFKTPITNIALASKMMSKVPEMKEVEKLKNYSSIIIHENEKLSLQVDQMLSLNALERGEMPLSKTLISFNQIVYDAIDRMNIQIVEHKARITLNLTTDNDTVLGDKIHLTNVLCNLIDNALKYCQNELHISIETVSNDTFLHILFSDNGKGIANPYREKIFDSYFRIPTQNIHNFRGYGLGLPYVKKILMLHKASISVNSDLGIGTCFTICFPYA